MSLTLALQMATNHVHGSCILELEVFLREYAKDYPERQDRIEARWMILRNSISQGPMARLPLTRLYGHWRELLERDAADLSRPTSAELVIMLEMITTGFPRESIAIDLLTQTARQALEGLDILPATVPPLNFSEERLLEMGRLRKAIENLFFRRKDGVLTFGLRPFAADTN